MASSVASRSGMSLAGDGRGLDDLDVAAPLDRVKALLGELAEDLVDVGGESTLGRSILFSATTIGTSAALAWAIASTVWGMTPSSAATTSTTMSVTLAPRARMAVKASWPGVSTNVIGLPLCSTW